MFLLLATTCLLTAGEPAADLLSFQNGDSLHGSYLGIDEGPLLKWQNPEADDVIFFETQNVRRVTLNNGRAKNPVSHYGMVELVNGDLLPGEIEHIDSKNLTLKTEFAGSLKVPLPHIKRLTPNPPGGPPLYTGPFNQERWTILPFAEADDDDAVDNPWHFSSACWYSNSQQVLALDARLEDHVSIRFQLAWQNNLNLTVALYADFLRPIPPAKDDPPAGDSLADAPPSPKFLNILETGTDGSHAGNFGSAYLLELFSSYSRLTRSFFDEDGDPDSLTFRPNSGGKQMNESFAAEVEIRCDRQKGLISVFVDGEQHGEWQDLSGQPATTGRHLAFLANHESRLRISDIVISRWNGMPDSARSMELAKRDVILFANGSDRLSGKLQGFSDGKFKLESDYATFQIPLSDVSDVWLASNDRIKPESPAKKALIVSLQPRGRLTLRPHEGIGNQLRGSSPALGPVDLDLSSAFLIEFDPRTSIFDNWDENF